MTIDKFEELVASKYALRTGESSSSLSLTDMFLALTGITYLTDDIEDLIDQIEDDEAKETFIDKLAWHIAGGAGMEELNDTSEPSDEGEPTVETYTAEEAAAYNATLPGAIAEGDEIDSNEIVPYEYIHDEESWQLSAGNGVLSKYYQNNPDEDRWNVTENRAGNFNDKVYEVEIGNGVYDFAAHWETDDVQKITNLEDSEEVYYLDMFYSVDEEEHELFTDVELTESANKTARFRKVKWNDETCPQCWEGAINAPGAKLPWVAVMFDDDVDAKLRFDYEGKDSVYPWGDTIFGTAEGHKEWGFASVAKEFDDDTFALAANGGSDAFDGGNFQITLVHTATAEEAIEHNSKLDGAVKAGDPKQTTPSEAEPQIEP